MFSYKFSLSVLFLCVQLLCNAQTVELPKQERNYSKKHCIYLNPGNLFIGDFTVCYEQSLKKHFSLLAGGGITFYNLSYNQLVINGINTWNLGQGYPSLPWDSGFRRHANIGGTFMIEPKYYFSKKDNQGFYIGLQFRLRKYNYSSNKYDYNYTSYHDDLFTLDLPKHVNEYRLVSDLLIEIGGSHYLGKHVNYQYYVGLGYRNNTINATTISNITLDSSRETIMSYQLSESITNLNGVAVTGGFRFGYVF